MVDKCAITQQTGYTFRNHTLDDRYHDSGPWGVTLGLQLLLQTCVASAMHVLQDVLTNQPGKHPAAAPAGNIAS